MAIYYAIYKVNSGEIVDVRPILDKITDSSLDYVNVNEEQKNAILLDFDRYRVDRENFDLIQLCDSDVEAIRFDRISKRRQTLLDKTDWLVLRHREQKLTGETTLTDNQYRLILEYRDNLRHMFELETFDVNNPKWPPVPIDVKKYLENL